MMHLCEGTRDQVQRVQRVQATGSNSCRWFVVKCRDWKRRKGNSGISDCTAAVALLSYRA
jgi:hypothetical protein